MAIERRPLRLRLMERVQIRKDGCWIYKGFVNKNGYAYIGLGGRGPKAAVHRASWTVFKGEIPDGMCVLHQCDRRCCVNPEHLFIGTIADNNRDMRLKCRHLYGESSPRSRLCEVDVYSIRKKAAQGEKQTDISREFRLSEAQVSRIVNGQTWSLLPATKQDYQ